MRDSQGNSHHCNARDAHRTNTQEHICTRRNNSKCSDDECSSGDCLVQNLNAVVLQYFENSGLEESYSTFCRECKIRGVPLPKELPQPSFPSINFNPRDGVQLLNLFDDEEGKEMLEMWNQFLDDIEPSQREAINTITFYLQIYVATIPYRQNKSIEEKQREMAGLRDFFQQKSNECITDENMLSLFALPFVADPMLHPIFKNMFQDPWRDKLRSQVSNVIRHHFQSRNNRLSIDPGSCELTQMYVKWTREDSGSGSDSEDNLPPSVSKTFLNKCNQTEGSQYNCDTVDVTTLKNLDLQTKTQFRKQNAEIENLKKNLLAYEDRYYKLLQVTGEVVGSLEQAVQGKAQDIEELIHRLQLVFPELFPSALIVQEMERQTNSKVGANANGDSHSSKEDNLQESDAEKHDCEELDGPYNAQENSTGKKANHKSRQESHAPDSNSSEHKDSKSKIRNENQTCKSQQKCIHEPDDSMKTTCMKTRSKKAVKPSTNNNSTPQHEEETQTNNHTNTTELENQGASLYQIQTSNPNDNEQCTSNRKMRNNTNAPRSKRTKSPQANNCKLENVTQQNSEQTLANKRQSQTNVKSGPRRFLQTQPQFAVRSESHPLSNYQHVTDQSAEIRQSNRTEAPVLDPRRKADAVTCTKSRVLPSPECTDSHIPRAPSNKLHKQIQDTPKNVEVSKTVVQRKGTAVQSRRTWAESRVENASQSVVTTPAPAPVPVARKRQSKPNLTTKHSDPEPPVGPRIPKRQIIDSNKSVNDQRPNSQNFKNTPNGQNISHEEKPTRVSNHGSARRNIPQAFTPADLERRYQWFARPDSDVKNDGSPTPREPKQSQSSRKHQSFVVHSP